MTQTVTHPIVRQKAELEPPYLVVIHNDDVTPIDFVIVVLLTVFDLSEEMAEHITLEAHHKGRSPVVTRPRPEAERLVTRAHGVARSKGFPLTFTAEPQG